MKEPKTQLTNKSFMKINRALIFSVLFLVPSIYLSAATFYVCKDNPNPQAPYDSWETAAQSIQDAIDVSSGGDLILVTNGVYDIGGSVISNGVSSRVIINKSVVVKSINGPTETFIVGGVPYYDIKTGSGAIRCVWMSDGAVLSGFTLTNGYTTIKGGNGNDQKYGGAVYGISTNAIVTNCVIVGNNGFEGGGVYSCSVFNSVIKNNSAMNGAGVHSSVLYNCVLTGNSAVWEGGAAHSSTLYNSIVTGNLAYTGGGAYNSTLNNCTITGNSANDTGGGVFSCDVKNSIVYYNSGLNGANYSNSVFNFSCTTPLPVGGGGNISDEPQLASLSHISAISPCLNKGDFSLVYGVDIDGEVWTNPPSIGADQLIPADTAGSLSMRIDASATRVIKGSTVSFISNNEGKITTSVWDFGDGSFATNQPFITHKFTNSGTNIVKLIGYNDTYPDGITAEVAIEVVSQEVCYHYVNVNSQNPVSPYTDWDTAATTIQDAIDAAKAGDIIIVSDGVYNVGGFAVCGLMTNRVVINKPLTVKSLNGPSKTIITGSPSASGTNGIAAIRGVWITNDAVLSGFTISNGYTVSSYYDYTYDDIEKLSGAGVWGSSTRAILTNCLIVNNFATCYGGGVYSCTLYDCVIKGNSASYGAGASGSILYNCAISNNITPYFGGGASDSVLHNCYIKENRSCSGGAADSSILDNCRLESNSALTFGGGAYSSTINNSIIYNNFGRTGGGAHSSILNNSTVIGNTAHKYSCGVDSSEVNNSIVYYNSSYLGSNYYNSSFNYSCTTPLPTNGVGNISDEPRMASLTHLSADSPCIGIGNYAYCSGLDIDGEQWQNPPSIGADQFILGNASGPINIGINAKYIRVIAGYEANFIASNEGLITTNVWDFGDGNVVTNQAYVTHRFATAGTYVVRLTGYNNSNPDGITADIIIEVIPEEIFYVDVGSTNPVPPYTNWSTAATNIQDGIDAAILPGSTVLVADGVYDKGVYGNDYGSNRIMINKPITVKSVNGPSKTYIVGDKVATVRCVFMTNDAVLSGFTIMNGNLWGSANSITRSITRSGGGVFGSSLFAVVTNCVLTNNYVIRYGGAAYNCSLFNSIIISNSASLGGGAYNSELYNCALNYNYANKYGGGAGNSTMYNCILNGNTTWYYDGGGAYNSKLFNCVLSGNIANNNGGGADNSTLVNCTVSQNYAYSYNEGGGGVYSCVLTNCIVYYNDNYRNAVNSNYYNSTFYYSCTTPLPDSGFGNTDTPPMFLDLTNGNYHLAPDSPCIDNGDNSVFQATFTDLDGRQRIIGDRVDIGAYEFDPGDLDSDGMPNEWERSYGLSQTDYRDRDIDTDNDGLTNFREYLANTSPSDSEDTLKLTTKLTPSKLIIFQFKAKANRRYAIEQKVGLEKGWKRMIEFNTEPIDRVLSITNSSGPEMQFYRIVIP